MHNNPNDNPLENEQLQRNSIKLLQPLCSDIAIVDHPLTPLVTPLLNPYNCEEVDNIDQLDDISPEDSAFEKYVKECEKNTR